MRWSLVTVLALMAIALPLYPGTEGGRIRRDDADIRGSRSPSWISTLLHSLTGSDGDDDNETDTVPESAPTALNSSAPAGNDSKTELIDLDDMKLTEKQTQGETTTTSRINDASSTRSTTTIPIPTSTETTRTTTTGTTRTSMTYSTSPLMTETTTTSSSTTENSECTKANDLTTYCEVSDDFKAYMQGNTTADAMTHKLFSPNVIAQLISTCRPGEWCLTDDYIQAFSDSMNRIFTGPLCSEGLLECLDLLLYRRQGCPDMMWISTFQDSLSLICEMYEVPEMTPECFGHTIATLHVTLADKIRDASQEFNYGNEFCLGAYVGMTRKFMCTLEKCPNHQKLFRDFEPWQWFMDDAQVIKDVCKLESVCGDEELLAEEAEGSTTGSTTSYSTSTEYPTENEEEPDHVDKAGEDQDVYHGSNQNKPYFIIQSSDESARLLIGITTGTIIAVLGLMVLVCAVLKRMRRRGKLLMKNGYSKLPTDDRD